MHPTNLPDMKERLQAEHPSLSKRLKEVSQYVQDNPQSIALETLSVIAEKANLPASTLVRFAQEFGFDGFSSLQKLYKDDLQQHYSDYSERIRERGRHELDQSSPASLLDELSHAQSRSLQTLRTTIEESELNAALDLLDDADSIHVCAVRRAFPLSMYITYALTHIGVRCHAIDGMGLMHLEQSQCIGKNDVLFAITYSPYSPAVRDLIAAAKARGARVLLLTDSHDCPCTSIADTVMAVEDADLRTFRSLNASFCIAQTLCVALGYRREQQYSACPLN